MPNRMHDALSKARTRINRIRVNEINSYQDELDSNPELRRESEARWAQVNELEKKYQAAGDPDSLSRAFLEVFGGYAPVLLCSKFPND